MGGWRRQEIPRRESERGETEGEKKKKHEKRVWGAPAFQVTPDPGPLCQPSAGLSGGFVGASSLNGHPADRHVVYPLCVLWGRERLLSVCASSERQVDRVQVSQLFFFFFLRLQHLIESNKKAAKIRNCKIHVLTSMKRTLSSINICAASVRVSSYYISLGFGPFM